MVFCVIQTTRILLFEMDVAPRIPQMFLIDRF
jgi:hypothetical protein